MFTECVGLLRHPADIQKNLRVAYEGGCHKRQKPQAPTTQTPIRNRHTRKDANAKVLNRNTNLT